MFPSRSTPSGHALSVFPFWETNPYLNLQFLECRARGWQVSGGVTVDQLFATLPTLQSGDVFHIQWTAPFCARITTTEEYLARVDAFVELVTEMKTRNVSVLWTVHNIIAHDTEFLEAEIQLAKELNRLADRIYVLSPATPQIASKYYELDHAKIEVLPHPSYLGVYTGSISKATARNKLDLPIDRETVGFIGAIRPYKGPEDYLEALKILAKTRPQCSALFGGRLFPEAKATVEASLPIPLPGKQKLETLTTEEIAYWMAACDVVVLPFNDILNSGSMLLAATYGAQVVVPGLPHLREGFRDERWVTFFDADTEPGPERHAAIAAAIDLALKSAPETGSEAIAYARTYTTFDFTNAYSDSLETL